MDRKARNSVLFSPSIHGGTGSGRPTGIISPAGHTYRNLSRVELKYQPSATRVRSLPGVILSDTASWSERRRGYYHASPLGLNPAVRLAASGIELTDKQLDEIADACWRAISRPKTTPWPSAPVAF
jgi:hypothetical protein